jgi:helicase
MTARDFRNAIEYDISKGRKHTFGFLHLITSCGEFFPKFDLRNKDDERVDIVLENNEQTKIKHIDVQDCTRSLLAMDLWIREGTEIDLSDQLGIESGDMHRMIETANWLVYSLRELSRLLGRVDLINELHILRQRIVYGIKEELIDLVKIKGVGRVRARKLYNNNIRSRQDLALTPVNQLAAIDKIGMTVANNIKSQLKVR